jgi:hypothetical protein
MNIRTLTMFAGVAIAAATVATAAQTNNAPYVAAVTPSALPITRQSHLGPNAPRTQAGRRYEDFSIELESGGRIIVSAESDAFDTMIEVYRGAGGAPIAQDDDGGEGFNSRLNFTAPNAGSYTIRVLSYRTGDQGAYSMSVLPPSSLPAAIEQPTRETAMAWQEFDGNVVETPGRRRGFVDHLVRLTANEEVILRADSTAFDTVLEVYRADNREGDPIDRDDDDGPGDNSLLLFRPNQTGDYVIRVRSYDRRIGSYRLGVGRFRAAEASAP